MLKNKIKKILSVVALGALITVGAGSVKSMAVNTQQNTAAVVAEDYSYSNYGYEDLIQEMLDEGYIDQNRATTLRSGINSENGQIEIDKTYDLYLVDLDVKEGYYSKEAGEIYKRVIEAEYAGNYDLADQIYDELIVQLDKEGVTADEDLAGYYSELVSEMKDAGYIDQDRANTFTNDINSENVQFEIEKAYYLYLIDLDVKEGYYSKEAGEMHKRLIEAEYAGNYDLADQIYDEFMAQLEKEGVTVNEDLSGYYSEIISEMKDAGYIDQNKANTFTNDINSENVQLEIDKMYDLYLIDLDVKEGYYSKEAGEIYKRVIEAEYAGNYDLADQIYDELMVQLNKEGVTADEDLAGYYSELISEMKDAGYIDQNKVNTFTNDINSENVQLEIDKAYDLYLIDLDVKEGYYSKEAAEIEKRLVEAEYAGNYDLADQIYDELMVQLEKEGLFQ
ncbi:hypothetical protein [Candidatus Arthromitus sp. SFB-rat-Yit]|uniref:hypothetical protein n=1 Tax=Candidatus Arthromitus sp. SFB-rat-Yit TaxID=1041504 RepID=UPI0002F81F86|nr:hypothetical protein [Candidatus Arthromitus sp. SFB-rat-Yit]